jgi:hypothetical protein
MEGIAAAAVKALRVLDVARESRWPAFARSAIDLGVHGMLSVPLFVTGDKLGGRRTS